MTSYAPSLWWGEGTPWYAFRTSTAFSENSPPFSQPSMSNHTVSSTCELMSPVTWDFKLLHFQQSKLNFKSPEPRVSPTILKKWVLQPLLPINVIYRKLTFQPNSPEFPSKSCFSIEFFVSCNIFLVWSDQNSPSLSIKSFPPNFFHPKFSHPNFSSKPFI